jgi:hypothetical protein
VHRGGVYGRVGRADAIWRPKTRRKRIRDEIARIAVLRDFDFIVWLGRRGSVTEATTAVENKNYNVEIVARTEADKAQ